MDIVGIPNCFDLSWLVLEAKRYDVMLCLGDEETPKSKAYIVMENVKDPKTLKIVGSSLKGRQMPKICDIAVNGLALVLFAKEDIDKYLRTFSRMDIYPIEKFLMSFTVTQPDYNSSTMYYDIIQKLLHKGLVPTLGTRIKFVKSNRGYLPLSVWTDNDIVDYDYYRVRIAKILGRMLFEDYKVLISVIRGGQRTISEKKTKETKLGDYT